MGKKAISNAFESELANALKTAAVQAAVNIIQSNPDLSLEDFYTVMRPQGVTESITVGDLVAVLNGKSVTAPASVKGGSPPSKKSKARKISKKQKVDCRTREGQRSYHASIVAYLRDAGDWVSSKDIRENCGGNTNQCIIALANHLIPEGIVEKRGLTFATEYRIAGGGKRQSVAEAEASDEVNATTRAGKEAYHNAIIRFLKRSKSWKSGLEITANCGGNKSQRNRALTELVETGYIEDNGVLRTGKRYRAL